MRPDVWALVFGAIALAGCFDFIGDPAPPPLDDEGRFVVAMTAENAFEPGHAVVPVGSTIVWDNKGGTHDVSATDGGWSSDDGKRKLSKGDTYARVFDNSGRYDHECRVHALVGMKGIVEVMAGNETERGWSEAI